MPSASSITSTGGISAGCSLWAISPPSVDLHAARLGGALALDADVQHAFAVGGTHLVRVEVVAQRYHAVEAAGEALVEVHARAIVVRQRGGALARDAEDAAFDLHLDGGGVEAGRECVHLGRFGRSRHV